VEGVALEGDEWSSSSPTAALGASVSQDVHDLLDKRFGSHGLDLHELAVLAATLENMIHTEAVQRLEAVYRVYNESIDGTLDETGAERMVESYMQVYVLGYNVSTLTRVMLDRLHARMDRVLPLWQSTREFLRDVQREVAPASSLYSFADVTRIVEAVSERYGRHQDGIECEDIQQKLLKLEEAGGTGRVKLHDFYASVSKHHFWQFREHPEFLKQAGVLDDSDPSTPRVMIPNYFNMPSNCFNPSSAFYSICCIDKCEALMDHVEDEIQAPSATPERIVGVISALASATVSANRTLPAELVRRLEEVAQQHGGVVPLHGRLFSQWMHFAYPRECSYPHVAGAAQRMSGEDWSRATGNKAALEPVELNRYIEQLRPPSGPADGRQQQQHEQPPQQQACDEESGTCMAMWHSAEELVDAGHWDMARRAQQQAEASFTGADVVRAVMVLGFVVSSLATIRGFVEQATDGFRVALAPEPGFSKSGSTKTPSCFV